MADLYVKSPKTSTDIGGATETNTSLSTVTGIDFDNTGFSATEVLNRVFSPSAEKKTEILALTDVVEITQAQWETEKANFTE